MCKKLVLVFAVAFAFCSMAMASDIAISTQANWWGQAAADREMQEIADNVTVDGVRITSVEQFPVNEQDALANWVADHTGDGTPDLLILCGQFPASIYPAGNAQPDGSLAELFLDDGNCIINTGDWIFYVVNGAGTNGPGGLQNMMDIPGVTVAGGDNTPCVVTADGQEFTPSLYDRESDRPFHLDTLAGDWEVELILAQDSGGTLADPVIVHNTLTDGRIGIFFEVADTDTDLRGEVMSEWINNWFLTNVAAPNPLARHPIPANGGVVVQTYTALAWTAGDGAVSHDVYFGEDFNDVTAGTGGTFVGSQPEASTIVGTTGYPYPDGLSAGVTYYWRIDEVEQDGTKHTGRVWSFSLPPGKAQIPVPADGRAYMNTDVTLSWTDGFLAALHYVYFGENAADVAAGTPDTNKGPSPNATYDPGPLENGKTYYWRIDEFDTDSNTHTGDVWSFSTKPDIPIRDPNLVGWWKLDDVGSGTVIDFSGYGHDGTLHGDAQFVSGGYDGGAMQFDGEGWVNMDGFKGVLRIAADNQKAFTCAAWINCTADNGTIMGWGQPSGKQRVEFRINGRRLRVEHGSGNKRGDTNVDDGTWRHVVLVVPEGSDIDGCYFYLDGQLEPIRTVSDGDPFSITANFDVQLARRYNDATDRDYTGQLDDVRLYDKVLTQEEVQFIMARPDPLKAWGPSPAYGSTPDLLSVASLDWSAGDLASEHDVYVGTDAQAVADADASDTTGIYKGRQPGTSYTPLAAFEPTETYYWRIDEYNTDGSITEGPVWSFTAGNFIVIDDAEDYDIDENQIWFAWRDGAGFGAPDVPPYSPGNGTGAEVGDGTTGSYTEEGIVNSGSQSIPYWYNNNKADKFNYSEAKLTLTSVRNWTQKGVKALRLSFRGYTQSVGSFTEDPAGTYTITGRGSNIYGSADYFHFAFKQLTGAGSIVAKLEVARNTNGGAKIGLMIRETLEPGSKNTFVFYRPDGGLRFNRRIEDGDTTSGDNPGGTYPLPQWLKLERTMAGDFTAYYSADGTTWEMIGTTQTVPMNSAVYVGLAVTSLDNDRTCEAVFSDVQIDGTVGQQWMDQDIGILSNDSEPMYVAVANSNGTTGVVYHENPNAALIDNWTQWNIDLKEFTDQGVNLADVNSIAVGFGNRDNPVAGGNGKIYLDDIRLYQPRCVTDQLKPAASFNNDCVVDYWDLELMLSHWLRTDAVIETEAPDPTGLLLHYAFDGNADDSSGNNLNGIEKAGPTYVAGKLDQAIHLDGFDDYVAIQDVNFATTGLTEVTVCCWIRTTQSTNGIMVAFDRNEYWRLQIAGEAGGPGLLGWHVMTTAPDGTEVQVDYGTSRRVDDGQWHHVAGTFDNGTLSIYIDGGLETVALGDVTFGTGDNRYGFVGIGSEATEFNGRPNATGYFDGDIDDLRIYTRALSQAEIAYLADDTPGDGQLYVSVPSAANLSDTEQQGSKVVNFQDYAVMADMWLDELLWPTE